MQPFMLFCKVILPTTICLACGQWLTERHDKYERLFALRGFRFHKALKLIKIHNMYQPVIN